MRCAEGRRSEDARTRARSGTRAARQGRRGCVRLRRRQAQGSEGSHRPGDVRVVSGGTPDGARQHEGEDPHRSHRVIRVRAERPDDRSLVRGVLVRAFPSDAEARLVDALRGKTDPQVSLVAVDAAAAERVIGHILFTPVEVRSGAETWRAIGLAPMAVAPERQREGIGAALVQAGIAACGALGEHVVVVLGHPDYYPRFGFVPAWDFGLYYRDPGPNPGFFVRELAHGALRGRRGEVVYHSAFDAL